MIEYDFSFANGNIVFNDMDIDPKKPLFDQIWSLKEDMLMVEFPNGYMIDVGWYPSFEEDGKFIIRLIKDHDWENVVRSADTTDPVKVESLIVSMIKEKFTWL